MSPTNRFMGKSAALAAAYGMGTPRIMGNNPTVTFFDGLMGLPSDQQAWADAFGEVLGVGDQFYLKAPLSRKRWLEAHYRELATHDTPKGRKAAKVVAIVVAEQLVPDPMYLAMHSINHDELEFKTISGLTDRASVQAQLDAYRYIFGAEK